MSIPGKKEKERVAPPEDNPDMGHGSYSSPPCFMHELDPAYLGFFGPEEVVALLNELLEAERAGVKVTGVMSKQAADSHTQAALRDVGKDEARFCAMLSQQVERLGGTPNREVGAFFDKVMALESLSQRLALLNRGQGWVVRKLQEALPRVYDEALKKSLEDMLRVHERNTERCAGLSA